MKRFDGEHVGSIFGYGVAALDYNGDGIDDLAVLSPSFNHPGGSETYPLYRRGKLYFYFGSPDFANKTQPDLTLLRSEIDDSLNAMQYLKTVDLNGDGLKDLMVYKYANPGLQLYSGINVFYSGTNCDTIPDFSYTFRYETLIGGIPDNHLWEPIGDVNGDGCEDIGFTFINLPCTGTTWDNQYYILYGDPVLPHLEYIATWGTDVPFYQPRMRAIGNVNQDAYDDFLVTYYNTDLNQPISAVVYGGTEINQFISPSQIIDIDFGLLTTQGGAYCGDINGDGVDDFIGDWSDYINPKIWLGGNNNYSNPSLILNGQCYQGKGFSYGDINGDGYDDIIFGDLNDIGEYGKVWIYLGGAYPNSSCDLIIYPTYMDASGDSFGWRTATGDFNNDGIADIAIGAPCLDYWREGYVFVYAGNTNILETTVSVDDSIPPASGLSFKAYPNPFNPNIYFELKNAGKEKSMKIDIFNLKGQKVDSIKLNGGQIKKGKVLWQANNMPSGIYLCQLKANDQIIASRKITLLK